MTDRRDFLKKLAGLTTAMMLPWHTMPAMKSGTSDKWGELLPLRKLGNTGESITMLGLGGNHITRNVDDKEAQRIIELAIEGGIRFFETADSYNSGESERRYGEFLVPKYRDECLIETKTRATDAQTAQLHLENSLRRMNLDYIDIWLVHAVRTMDDFNHRFDNGVLNVFEDALASGKVRYIGFSGHDDADTFAHLVEQKNIFQVVQMPVNPVDAASENSFVNKVIPRLLEREMGIIAMKTLANGRFFEKKENTSWSTDNPVVPNHISVRDIFNFVWSLPVSSIATGPDNADMLSEKIALARDFATLNEEERLRIVSKVQSFGESNVEFYKS